MAWIFQEDHYEFMSDRTYRSAPPSPWLYNDLLTRRVMASYGYENGSHCDAFGDILVDGSEYAMHGAIPVFLGQPRMSYYPGEVVGRNLRAAVANGAIPYPSSFVQIQPMLRSDGRYPADFSAPRRLIDFQEMGEHQLSRIMTAYDLVPNTSRYNDALRCPLLLHPYHHRTVHQQQRLANLIALFDFLAAYRIAEALRCRGRSMLPGGTPTYRQYEWY
ncbi:hypothetical protein AC578_11147 [Pseudocercospora eumusae]|uniref:Uncharacterized protein n=1 Tax=Pseudocercospora eumusae TaxID=321146 RepID=A0A139GVB7_9PEZI|nr:hypothetical protein AC578_11147 [Pseudocercospora eumusae]KXS94148.1 hypothetical protein AC578_11147 [Pseudocercospora eumusae]